MDGIADIESWRQPQDSLSRSLTIIAQPPTISYLEELQCAYKARRARLADAAAAFQAEQSQALAKIVLALPKPILEHAPSIPIHPGRPRVRYLGPSVIVRVEILVAERFRMSREELLNHRRFARRAKARHVVFYLVRELTRRSFPEIGRLFGGRDHTTVLHGVRRIAAMIGDHRHGKPMRPQKYDPEMARLISEIRAEIES